MPESTYIACHECDLLVELTQVTEGSKASCPRCNCTLTANHINAQNRVLAFSISALVFLILSFLFPFLTFKAQGQERVVTLMQSINVSVIDNFASLSVIIFISIILIPVLFLFSNIYVYLSFKLSYPLTGTRFMLKMISHLKHWSMADIFLVGILVSFIKIASLAEVTLGLSFIAYVFFIFSMTAAALHFDKHQAWQWLKHNQSLPAKTQPTMNYQVCHVCTDITEQSETTCRICHSPLHPRKKNSLQKTWAYLITSAVLYFPANFLPIMKTNFLGEETASTILGGVVVLWQHGSYPIALIIFIASVLVPIGKLIGLGWLCYKVQNQSTSSQQQKTQLYRLTELVGRWSMIDVFVVAVLVALIKLGNIMSVYPGLGVIAFAVMVLFSVLAALSFDPRLIWDPIRKEKAQ